MYNDGKYTCLTENVMQTVQNNEQHIKILLECGETQKTYNTNRQKAQHAHTHLHTATCSRDRHSFEAGQKCLGLFEIIFGHEACLPPLYQILQASPLPQQRFGLLEFTLAE